MAGSSAIAGPDHAIDSMLTAIQEHRQDDTTKVNMYVALANMYKYNGVEPAYASVVKGLAIAERLHFDKGIADCEHIMGITWLFKAQYDKANHHFRRALAIYEQRGDNGGMANTYHLMGINYAHQEKFDTANGYFNAAITYGRRNKDTALVSDAIDNIGSSYLSTGNYPEALDHFLKGLRMREQLNYKLAVAVSLSI